MRECVEPDHIGGPEGSRARATQLLARQVVHNVVAQMEVVRLVHRRQHRGDADAVGDEVGRIVRAHHPLSKAAGQEGFQAVQDRFASGRRIDQFDQRHVARRVEEMDAAKTRLDRFW